MKIHENQIIADRITNMAKEALSNINDKHFTRSEIWDFIGDIVQANGKDQEIDKVFNKWSKK